MLMYITIFRKGVDLLKPMTSIKLNPRSSTLSFLLEDDCFISSTSDSYVRFLDLETLNETSILDPKKLGGVVRNMEYRYSDRLLFTICGKKVQVSSLILIIYAYVYMLCVCTAYLLGKSFCLDQRQNLFVTSSLHMLSLRVANNSFYYFG